MVASLKKNMWFARSGYGDVQPEIRNLRIAASQGIFMPNAPCYLSEAGTVKRTDTSDDTDDAWHGIIVGVRDKTTTWPLTAALAVNTIVRVQMFRPLDYYKVFVENNGTDSAIAVTDIGDQFGMKVSATAGEVGYTTMDLNSTNNVVCRVEDIMPEFEAQKHAVADNPGIALVRILTGNIEATKA